jgi:hypothetical protein
MVPVRLGHRERPQLTYLLMTLVLGLLVTEPTSWISGALVDSPKRTVTDLIGTQPVQLKKRNTGRKPTRASHREPLFMTGD